MNCVLAGEGEGWLWASGKRGLESSGYLILRRGSSIADSPQDPGMPVPRSS